MQVGMIQMVTGNRRSHPCSECVNGRLAIGVWNGRCVVRLLRFPNERSFVLIQFVSEFVTRFDHQFVKVMAKFRGQQHRDSLTAADNNADGSCFDSAVGMLLFLADLPEKNI
jgi:hypothetical protein